PEPGRGLRPNSTSDWVARAAWSGLGDGDDSAARSTVHWPRALRAARPEGRPRTSAVTASANARANGWRRAVMTPTTLRPPGADGDLPGEEPEEQRRLGEPAGHRPLHPDRLGQGVGGRERHHGGGQRRGAEQADGEEVGGGRAGGRLEGPGGVVGGRQGPVAA